MALAIRQSRSFALLAAAAGALTPGLLLSSASVNNDNAAILTGSLALLAAVKALTSSARRWLWVGMYGLMAFLAVQSKASAYFLLPVSVLLAGLMLRNRGRRALIASGLGVLAATVLGGLALQTTRFSMLPLLHSVPSVLQADWDCNCTMFLQHYWGAIPNLWETYWGSYGWETFHPPQPAYRPFTLVTVLGVAGLLWGCWRKLRSGTLKSWLASDRGASLVLLVSAFFVLLVMVDYRVLATRSDGGTTHARFLFPAVAASTIFLVLGISALPDLLRKTGFFVLFSASLALVAYSVFVLPRSFGLTVPVYGDPEAAGAQELLAADFSNGMQLVGWSRPDGGVAPGQQLHLRLFWGASKPPDFDYSAFVRLDDRNGLLVHDADHGPGASIQLLSHLWQPGEVIPDDWTINLPASAHPGQYQVEVGLYDYRDLKPVVDTQNQAYVTLGNVTV
ncbi:MAG TPA: hypothetical protein VKU60_19810, partial [Chloroflexota bacterium]|nr:hypothetical protein [Chloroflexota bacterium]